MTTVPRWMDQDFSPCDLAAVLQGGCESGAYMPAVTYHQALETMAEHGDEIFDYLETALGEIPKPGPNVANAWSAWACFYVSCAVELWCAGNEELADWDDTDPIS